MEGEHKVEYRCETEDGSLDSTWLGSLGEALRYAQRVAKHAGVRARVIRRTTEYIKTVSPPPAKEAADATPV